MSNCVLYPYDITIHEGTTFDRWFRWLVDNVVQSLNGFTGLMHVRTKATDELPVINLPFVADPWEADGKSGIYLMTIGSDDRYQIYINNADTSGICPSFKDIEGVYNLFLYNAEDECVLKQYGKATLIAAIARPDPII